MEMNKNLTTITIRTDSDLKDQATLLFESLGMNLSTAINLFMKQAVLHQKYPCSLDLEITQSAKATYPDYFWDLFGTGNNLGFDEEPDDPATESIDYEL